MTSRITSEYKAEHEISGEVCVYTHVYFFNIYEDVYTHICVFIYTYKALCSVC